MPKMQNRYIKLTPELLAGLLEENGLSQVELAGIVGTSQPALALMLAGKRNITARMTTRIYDALEWYLEEPEPEERARWQAQIQEILDEGGTRK